MPRIMAEKYFASGDKIIQNCASKISEKIWINNYPQKS